MKSFAWRLIHPSIFLAGNVEAASIAGIFFLKYCPLHPAEVCNGFLASDWLYSLWNEIKLAIDSTR